MALYRTNIELDLDAISTPDNTFSHTVEADDESGAISKAKETYPTARVTVECEVDAQSGKPVFKP